MKEYCNGTLQAFSCGYFCNKAILIVVSQPFYVTQNSKALDVLHFDTIHVTSVRDKDGRLVEGVACLVVVVTIPFDHNCWLACRALHKTKNYPVRAKT